MKKGDLVKLHDSDSIAMMINDQHGIVLESRIQELYSQVRVDKEKASLLVNPLVFEKYKYGDVIQYADGVYLIIDMYSDGASNCLKLNNPERGNIKTIYLTDVTPASPCNISVSNYLTPGRKVQYKGSEYTVVHDPEHTLGEDEVTVIDTNFQLHVLPTKDLNI